MSACYPRAALGEVVDAISPLLSVNDGVPAIGNLVEQDDIVGRMAADIDLWASVQAELPVGAAWHLGYQPGLAWQGPSDLRRSRSGD